jgi:hypothetical protein
MRYIDDFQFSDDWPYIQITNGSKIISRGYMNKSPQIAGKVSEICIFHKYTIYRIDPNTCTGNVIVSKDAQLPNLKINITKKVPYTIKYCFDFDFHTMMVVLHLMDDVVILEHKNISLVRSSILYHSIKIEVVQTVFSYTGTKEHDLFYDFCERVYVKYKNESESYIKLFKQLPSPEVDPGKTHLALAYDIWYRGSRENQREWPEISTYPKENSIEFPRGSGIWYTPPQGKYIGLSLRHDDNVFEYIPRIYMRDQRLYNSYLRDYLDNTNEYDKFSIPTLVKQSIRFFGSFHTQSRPYNGSHDVMYLNNNGTIMMTYNNPRYIVYIDRIIGTVLRYGIHLDADVQLLDSDWNRIKICKDGVWHDSHGPRMLGIPTLPWYYRQIVHDYNKLGRLRNGPYMDLMHIGIVDTNKDDIITFPVEDMNQLYVADSLETRRLLTFKFTPYVYENHIIKVTKDDEE